MHLDLRRGTEAGVSLKHFSFFIYLADILRGHEALGNSGRRAEEFMIIELYGDISVVGRNHVPIVDSLANVTNLFFNFKFVNHLVLFLLEKPLDSFLYSSDIIARG